MGVTKIEGYTQAQNNMAELLKALGHPARIAIIEFLKKSNQCICTDIVDELPLSQPAISRHLKVLKSVGLIKGSIESTAICYCIDMVKITEVERYFRKMCSDNLSSNHC